MTSSQLGQTHFKPLLNLHSNNQKWLLPNPGSSQHPTLHRSNRDGELRVTPPASEAMTTTSCVSLSSRGANGLQQFFASRFETLPVCSCSLTWHRICSCDACDAKHTLMVPIKILSGRLEPGMSCSPTTHKLRLEQSGRRQAGLISLSKLRPHPGGEKN
jgi:hypothetical protein